MKLGQLSRATGVPLEELLDARRRAGLPSGKVSPENIGELLGCVKGDAFIRALPRHYRVMRDTYMLRREMEVAPCRPTQLAHKSAVLGRSRPDALPKEIVASSELLNTTVSPIANKRLGASAKIGRAFDGDGVHKPTISFAHDAECKEEPKAQPKNEGGWTTVATKGMSYQLDRIRRAPRVDRSAHVPVEVRRMDSLARVFDINESVVSAVGLAEKTKGKFVIYLAANHHPEGYLQAVENRIAALTEFLGGSRGLSSTAAIVGRDNWFPRARIMRDLKKLFGSVNRKSEKSFSVLVRSALRAGAIEVHPNSGRGVHAEVALAGDLAHGSSLGITKLSCGHCEHYLQEVRPDLQSRGTHGRVFPGWTNPTSGRVVKLTSRQFREAPRPTVSEQLPADSGSDSEEEKSQRRSSLSSSSSRRSITVRLNRGPRRGRRKANLRLDATASRVGRGRVNGGGRRTMKHSNQRQTNASR